MTKKQDTVKLASVTRQHIIDTWHISPWGCGWSEDGVDEKCSKVEDCSYCPFYTGNSAFNPTMDEIDEWEGMKGWR